MGQVREKVNVVVIVDVIVIYSKSRIDCLRHVMVSLEGANADSPILVQCQLS